MPFLASSVYEYIVTGNLTSVTLETKDIPDPSLKYFVEKVCIL